MKRLIVPALILVIFPLMMSCRSSNSGDQHIRSWRSRHTIPSQNR